jgi:uncharacterized protein YciI
VVLIEKIDELVPAHRQFLDKQYQLRRFIGSGACTPRNGGVIVCNAGDSQEVKAIIAEDPFYINQAATYDILEFVPSKYATDFKNFI